MSGAVLPASHIQYGALPWRRIDGVLEILLITTRRTQRWIVPKGWPIAGHTGQECAAQEALEEAGVLGDVGTKPLGWFSYDKLRKSGEIVHCKVQVYPLKVASQRRNWAEKAARRACWCSPREALVHVREPGLRLIIRKFTRKFTVATERRVNCVV